MRVESLCKVWIMLNENCCSYTLHKLVTQVYTSNDLIIRVQKTFLKILASPTNVWIENSKIHLVELQGSL